MATAVIVASPGRNATAANLWCLPTAGAMPAERSSGHTWQGFVVPRAAEADRSPLCHREGIRGQPPAQRLKQRQARSRPIVEKLDTWIGEQRARLSRKSPMGGALAYIANHWGGLRVFLEDGRVEMDNNPVENLIRPLALNRKNALFCGHDEGGASWARIASLVETCKLNGVDPYAYLRDTLEAIAAGHPQSRLDDLLPWAFTPGRPNP